MSNSTNAGLAGVVAGKTAIASVGKGQGLIYRGYDIYDLAEHAQFEEVAYLLIYDNLPNDSELAEFTQQIIDARALPKGLRDILILLPAHSLPMDILRTTVSVLGCLEPEETDFSNQDEIMTRLLGILPSALIFWYNHHHRGEDLITESMESSMAGYFLKKLIGKSPCDEHRAALNTSLILYAEHEFNASTFATRVTTSTLSDIYSCITTGIGVLRGPLHGGANEAAMALIRSYKNTDEAASGIRQKLLNKDKIMGFGHRVYKECDPRNKVIKEIARRLAPVDDHLFEISETIENVMWDEKRLFPNLDFYSASAYHFMGIPVEFYTPMFVLARVSGWCAHIKEQRADNRLIRPSAEYCGPEKLEYIALDQR